MGDAAYINLEIEALHARTREMSGQGARSLEAEQYASRPHRRMFDARTIRLLPGGTLLDPYTTYEVWYDETGSKVIGIGFAG